MNSSREPLLSPDEPPACVIIGEPNSSPFLILCDHAGNRLPQSLGDLGVSEEDRGRHIAWDIGIAGVVRGMAARLGAMALLQPYSRLVIDCNRAPEVAQSIVEMSERTLVPGNAGLTRLDIDRRIDEIFRPYHDRIATELDRRKRAGIPTILVAMHSFTPVYMGVARPWHVGLLYNRDARLANLLISAFEREGGLVVGDNQPYFVSDETDYTIPVHGERRGLPHAEVEIRQDLIEDEPGQEEWAERMARLLRLSAPRLSGRLTGAP